MSQQQKTNWQRHLHWLIGALAALMLALALIAIAGTLLQDGLAAEIIALAGIAIAIPALTIGIIAFVMLIYARIRTVLSKDSE